ncbi:MAG: DUF2207 domain-containing protein [Bdellovibrionales bacterium]|nr:DUF2207 domain-containing protein [Bdellovibrionales bacterium]
MSIFARSFFVIAIGLLLSFSATAQQERITNYDVDILVRKDSSLIVTEQITVFAGGQDIKRGIYRDFPTDYKGPRGLNYRVGFDVLEVLKNGKQEPYHVTPHANGKRVYIGDKNVFLASGIYQYTLRFKTNFQLGFFEDHDELYFNAIGHGWVFPVEQVSVSVELPDGITADKIKAEGYTGPQGAKGQDYRVDSLSDSAVKFSLTRSLNPYQGFTIVVTWPKGFVEEPSQLTRLLSMLWANLDNGVGIVGLLALVFFYATSWSRVGKDPDPGTIIPRFEAPTNVTPFGIRYIQDMGYSNRCFTALLYDLAVRGFLRLEESGGSFTLHRLKDDFSDESLLEVERKVLLKLFPGSQAIRKIDKKDWSVFKKCGEEVGKSLKAKHLEKTFLSNDSYFWAGIVFTVCVCGLMFGASGFNPDEFFDPVNLSLGGVMVLAAGIFKFLIKAPTKLGRKVMDEIAGYKMYLKTAERDRLGNLAPAEITPELYEKHLPYAVALGVDQDWTKNFEKDLNRRGQDPNSYNPRWYNGGRRWNDQSLFGNTLGDSIASSIAASSSPPGSSSGSGGGGSSGGGGGGGGGGGW